MEAELVKDFLAK